MVGKNRLVRDFVAGIRDSVCLQADMRMVAVPVEVVDIPDHNKEAVAAASPK
jgi:hypothetical protein